jgi:hypothetical protein
MNLLPVYTPGLNKKRKIKINLPRTRSSITWVKIDITVVFPIRARAIDAAERIKSPARTA